MFGMYSSTIAAATVTSISSPSLAHDLHVRTERRILRRVLAVQSSLGLEDDFLRFGQRRVADAETRVVSHRDAHFVLAEDLLQIAAALAEFHVDDDVLADGQTMFSSSTRGRPRSAMVSAGIVWPS